MRGYALTCLALVIGRLEPQCLETILEAFEGHLFQALLSQVLPVLEHQWFSIPVLLQASQ